eukprot:scaffold462_cov32-Tisochrysis_lutea.AAC.1
MGSTVVLSVTEYQPSCSLSPRRDWRVEDVQCERASRRWRTVSSSVCSVCSSRACALCSAASCGAMRSPAAYARSGRFPNAVGSRSGSKRGWGAGATSNLAERAEPAGPSAASARSATQTIGSSSSGRTQAIDFSTASPHSYRKEYVRLPAGSERGGRASLPSGLTDRAIIPFSIQTASGSPHNEA